MDGQQGYSGVPSDGQHGHPPSSGYVRIPYPSIGPLHQVPPPPVVNYQPAYHLSHPQHQGVQGLGGGINLNGPAIAAAMNAGVGVMPTAPLLTMPAPPSVPANFYLANNNNPFSAGAGFAYTTPAPQPVPVMSDPEMSYPPEVPFDPRSTPPFADRAQLQFPRPHGVLKIENKELVANHVNLRQIPYTISIPEMQQFICKYIPQSHLIEPHVAGYPIHIIMERSTGKTMDCYVEIVAPEIAARDWEHAFDPKQMRIPKIGQRNVEVTLSNQSELMKDMFPRANCIHFKADQFGAPVLVPNRDIFSSGYKGFMTNEELTCIVRHAEYPQRFANRSMQRTFESMISTLYKTQQMFDAYKKQLDVLIVKVDASRGTPREVGLDNKLLMDFVFAGLNAPGFSERQRAEIVKSSQALACGFQTSKHARYWPFTTLSTVPPHLSDQDVGMWLEILNVGMGVMEAQNRKIIGIEPYLRVIRDPEGYILFVPSETALDLKRGQFSVLEKRVMNDMIQLGWQSYMRQMGVESPTHMQYPGMPFFSNNNFTVGAAHVDPVDPFTAAGSSNTGPGGPANNNDNNGQESGNGGNDNVLDIQNGHDLWFDDDEYPDEHEWEGEFSDSADEANKTSDDNVDDPEKALQAMRDVLKQVSQAPPSKQQADVHKQSGFDADTAGLGASLQNIELSGGNNGAPGPTIVGSLPPQRPARASTVVDHPFNPETPAFEPPAGWKQRHHHTPTNSDSTLGTGTVFGGSGLGNGNFASPQRISTARNNNNNHNNKGKGKEPAATTAAAGRGGAPVTAAGIRLQPAAPIFARPPPTVAFGRADAVAAQPALFQVPNNGRERRGVTIRSASGGGSSLASLQRTSALETTTTVPATGGPGALLTQSPEGGAQNDGNTADSLDEFLDDLFGETTSQADRVAMRTPTPSTTPLIAPVTPLRRTVGRVPSAGIGPVEDDYDDGEVVNNSVPADMPSSSPSYINYSDRSSNSGAAPVTGPPEYRGPGSGWEGYSPISQTDLSPTRVPRRLAPGFGTNLVGSPYPVRMTRSEVTAEKRSTRMDFQRLNLHIDDTIDEEETES
ncbi:hypothetical protein AYO22_05672 [Fonsecaea multimorphosa]|nr:hypothetical protein AYO22_05672 [Fonsecaea multimorphosa]